MLLQLVVLSLEDPSAPTDRHANICSRLHKPHIDGVEVFSRRVYQMAGFRYFISVICKVFHIHRTWRMALAPLFPAITLPHLPVPLFLLVSLAQASSLSGGVCRSSWCVSCSAAWCCTVMDAVAKRAAGHTHTRVHTQTHTHGQEESLPRDSLFISLITILLVSE